MHASHKRRVFVGVDRSLTGLEALRVAANEARLRDAKLCTVRVMERRQEQPATTGQPPWSRLRVVNERGYIIEAFEEALGGFPAGIRIQTLVKPGKTGPVLVGLADREDDLIVVGTGSRGLLRRLTSGSVGPHCIAHACCPVTVVPPHAFAREADRRRLLETGRLERATACLNSVTAFTAR